MKPQAIKIEVEPAQRHPVIIVLQAIWILTKATAKLLYKAVKGLIFLVKIPVHKWQEHKHQAVRR
jgi:hypothetical protein